MKTKSRLLKITKATKNAGFTSVFIVMILSSLMLALPVIITASLDRASDTLSEIVSANAGASVLSECNRELYERYGIFAVRNDCRRLSGLADYYISEAIDGSGRFIDLRLNAAIVDTGRSSCLFCREFRKQIVAQGKKSFVCPKSASSGLSYFSGEFLPSRLGASHALQELSAGSETVSLLDQAGGAFFICSYAMNNFTHSELEYLIFGREDAYSNELCTRNLIFGLLCVKNCIQEIEDPLLWIEAVMRAHSDTDRIMNSPSELEGYLRSAIYLMSGTRLLLLRMMDIMQLSIGNGFYFKDYAYSFELTAQFSRGGKTGVVRQYHSYTH